MGAKDSRCPSAATHAAPPLLQLFGKSCAPAVQFEAVSVALWGTPLYHPLLRQLAVAYMRASPEEYAVFLGDDLEAYLK